MSSDPFCSVCIFGDWLDHEEDAPLSCRKCIILTQRPNFISIYRNGKRPKFPNTKRGKKLSKKQLEGSDRTQDKQKTPRKKKRTIAPKKEETWSLIAPVKPRMEEDPKTKLYKVMYRNKETGEWFYDVCTHDKIGPKEGWVVEDILDYIEA